MTMPNIPDLKEVKSKASDVGKMQICTSVDLGMKLCRRGGGAVKSASVHCSCKIGLVKAVLFLLGAMLVVAGMIALRRSAKKKREE